MLTLQVASLAYDIAGVGILAWAAVFRGAREVAEQGGTYWNENKPFMTALAENKTDTAAGSIMLLFGFMGQAVASVGVDIAPVLASGLYVALGGAIVLYATWIRKTATSAFMKRALDTRETHGKA